MTGIAWDCIYCSLRGATRPLFAALLCTCSRETVADDGKQGFKSWPVEEFLVSSFQEEKEEKNVLDRNEWIWKKNPLDCNTNSNGTLFFNNCLTFPPLHFFLYIHPFSTTAYPEVRVTGDHGVFSLSPGYIERPRPIHTHCCRQRPSSQCAPRLWTVAGSLRTLG